MPFANVNGIRLYYRVCGQGESLVLIPGMGADHGAWFRQIAAFKRYHTVITFDPRSIGKSDRPKEPYSFRTLADDVIRLMDFLNVGRAHVLGQSLGGVVAQEVAIDYPDRMLKLLLVSSGVVGGEINPINPALLKTLGYGDGADGIDFSKLNARKIMNVLIGHSFNRSRYRIAMLLLSRFFVKQQMFDGLSDQVSAISGHNTLDRLHLIKSPTLVMTGAADHIISPSASEVIAGRIPNAKLVMVKGGSHGFNVEMTSTFNRAILDFLVQG